MRYRMLAVTRIGRLVILSLFGMVAGCANLPPPPKATGGDARLSSARQWARQAEHSGAAHAWLRCAGDGPRQRIDN